MIGWISIRAAICLGAAVVAFSAWLLQYSGIDPWAFLRQLTAQATPRQALALFFLFALIETIFPACHYFPGTLLFVTLFLGSEFASQPVLVAAIASSGILTGLVINYSLARLFAESRYAKPFQGLIGEVREIQARWGLLADGLLTFHPNWIGLLYVIHGLAGGGIVRHLLIAVPASCAAIAVYLTSVSLLASNAPASPGDIQLWVAIALSLAGLGLFAWDFPRRRG